MKRKLQYLPGALLLALGATPIVASVSIPHTFESGETAVAAEVNANFEALRQQFAEARSQIEAMQKLHEHVEVIADPNYPNEHTVRFSGVNVQIVNGLEETESTNGLGNLIVGYNEPRGGSTATEVCSLGQYDNSTNCTSNGGAWDQNHKSGSHNIVGGTGNAYSAAGGLVVGLRNTINREYATVTGGWQNTASGAASSVAGGLLNIASESRSHVSGGQSNTASGLYSTVSGGMLNTASRTWSSVSGGHTNTAEHNYSSILGGQQQSTSSLADTIPAIQPEDAP
ncbi:hypothetical protein [Thioalkalivibrio sp. AKL10]|uniref:hypothetical protein n=1 Tax=Thioalkalivibrio sp. AKL10 TaxID=1158158 RepID=UPI000370D24A|nr:hypothetical protein [Thioalkalivibrio sp. AKL10]